MLHLYYMNIYAGHLHLLHSFQLPYAKKVDFHVRRQILHVEKTLGEVEISKLHLQTPHLSLENKKVTYRIFSSLFRSFCRNSVFNPYYRTRTKHFNVFFFKLLTLTVRYSVF